MYSEYVVMYSYLVLISRHYQQNGQRCRGWSYHWVYIRLCLLIPGKIVGMIHVKQIIKYEEQPTLKYNQWAKGPYCWIIDDACDLCDDAFEYEGNENPMCKALVCQCDVHRHAVV